MQFIVYIYRTDLIAEHIQLFFPKYVQVFDDAKVKSNTHFFSNYPHMIRRFGSLVKTLRFEADNGLKVSIAKIKTGKLCVSI